MTQAQIKSMIDDLQMLGNQEFLGNTIAAYLTSLSLAVILILLIYMVRYILLRKVKTWIRSSSNDLDDVVFEMIEVVTWPFIFAFSIGISSRFLNINDKIDNAIRIVSLIVGIYFVIKIAIRAVEYIAYKTIERLEKEDRGTDSSIVKVLKNVAIGIIWTVGIIIALENSNVDVSALVAGVGVGSIAIAFALQSVLEDIFASFSIYFDKPFRVGDVVEINGIVGKVMKIGIKTSRIKTLSGEELVVPNQNVTTSNIRNYKRMRERRIEVTFGVVYNTPAEKLKKILTLVKETLEDENKAELDRIHLKELGESAIVYEMVYYVKSSDYSVYMDIQQDINFEILTKFEKEDIELAYPTHTVINK